MRPEQLYLTDILDAARSIASFCKDVHFEQFEGNDMLRSAVLQKLIVIGEAAAHRKTNWEIARGILGGMFFWTACAKR